MHRKRGSSKRRRGARTSVLHPAPSRRAYDRRWGLLVRSSRRKRRR